MTTTSNHQKPRSLSDINQWLAQHFPEAVQLGTVIKTEPMGAQLRLNTGSSQLRPGNTVSGPTQMALADLAMYAALLAQPGDYTMAVTSNMNINFLQRPREGELLATARLLKLGHRLAVGDVLIQQTTESTDSAAQSTRLVAQASLTYALPTPHKPSMQKSA